jgi:pathogenesis-related protein 1
MWEPLIVRLTLEYTWVVIAAGTAWAQPHPASNEMLQAHNSIRRGLGLPGLAWSDRLAARAQEWAETLLAKNQFLHSPKPLYGENLFEMTGAQASPTQVVLEWASESRNYDYRSNGCRGTCGHYTQIIWRDTREVGCGVARGARREVWVCEYNPPGNWVGKRPYLRGPRAHAVLHSGGWHTLQAVNPFALASFRLMGILLVARYLHPSR